MMDYQSVSRKQVLFVSERMPKKNSSGAESYNWSVFSALEEADCRISFLLTGDYFSSPIFNEKILKTLCSECVFLQKYKKIGPLYFATTLKAYLRPFKRLLSFFSKNNYRDNDLTLKIGKYADLNGLAKLIPKIREKEFDIVFVDTLFRTPVLDLLPDMYKVLVAHDVFHRRCASFKSNGYRVEPDLDEKLESIFWRKYDFILSINSLEKDVISNIVPEISVQTFYPTSVSCLEPIKSFSSKLEPRLLYMGADAHHNRDGLRWFFDTVWPEILLKQPNVQLDVIGNIENSFKYPIENVNFHGRVNDVTKIAAGCLFAINPVRMGSGIKIKMVDYFNLGLPCVTTEIGAYGFPLNESTPFVACADAEQFLFIVNNWLDNSHLIEEFSNKTSKYAELFSSNAAAHTVSDILENSCKAVNA
jgi:hypothetical protein